MERLFFIFASSSCAAESWSARCSGSSLTSVSPADTVSPAETETDSTWQDNSALTVVFPLDSNFPPALTVFCSAAENGEATLTFASDMLFIVFEKNVSSAIITTNPINRFRIVFLCFAGLSVTTTDVSMAHLHTFARTAFVFYEFNPCNSSSVCLPPDTPVRSKTRV